MALNLMKALLSVTILPSSLSVFSSMGPQPDAMELYPPTISASFEALIDHFTYDKQARFNLRYMGTDDLARGKDSPVLLYFGNEGEIEGFYNASGAMFDIAKDIGGVVMFVEHRYYGKSNPFGDDSWERDNLKYLTIEQANADYAEFIVALPKIIGCTSRVDSSSPLCDVISFGGSYGGMLAAWHRFKYPHLTVGALVSGAPIDFYPNNGEIQRDFYDAFVNTFEVSRAGCGGALTELLSMTYTEEEVSAKSCSPTSATVEKFMFYVKGAVSSLAMIDYPYPAGFIAPLPANPVEVACDILLGDGDPLHRLTTVVDLYVNGTGKLDCYDLGAELVGSRSLKAIRGTDLGVTSWNYQACTELPLEPITSDGYGFYPPDDAQLPGLIENCQERFGVSPRMTWLAESMGTSKDYT